MPAYAVLTTVSNQPGILFGLTKATPDNTFKINLEYEWGPGGHDGAERIDDD